MVSPLISTSHALEKFNERLIALVTRLRSERYTSLLFKLCQEQINCSKFILSRRAGLLTAAATQRYLTSPVDTNRRRRLEPNLRVVMCVVSKSGSLPSSLSYINPAH